MAVTFDAVGPSSSGHLAGAVSSTSWSHTCSGSPDRAIIIAVGVGANDNPTINSVTYNSVAATSLAKVYSNNQTTAGYIELFGLVNPTSGANSVQVTMSASTATITGGSVSFLGVAQDAAFSPATTDYGAAAPASVELLTTAGNMVADMVCSGVAVGTSGQTLQWARNANTSTGAGNTASSIADAGGSATMGYTVTDWWAMAAVEVLASEADDSLVLEETKNRKAVRGMKQAVRSG